MDAVTKKWFDDATVTVVRAPELADFMTDLQIIRITGAPSSSTITVMADEEKVSFRVENAMFDEPMYLYLVQLPEEGLCYYLRNVVFVLADSFTNKGIGPRCVAREIVEATRWKASGIPISHIRVSAVGDIRSFALRTMPLRGYYVWATMGFDAPIPSDVRASLAPCLQQCQMISDLVATPAGREAWQTHGQSMDLEFDLTAGSVSWHRLIQYMKEKGIVP